MQTVACFKCQHAWNYEPPLARGEECPKCRWDAHVCMNCRHYDRQAYRECRENQAEFVQNKERSNFCDWFEPLAQQAAASSTSRDKLEALFGSSPQSPAKTAGLDEELKAFLESKKRS